MRTGGASGNSPWARLGDLDVSDAEHELEDAIAAGDDGGLGHEYGPGPLLGVADARKQDADGQGVQKQPEHALRHQHRRGPRAVVGPGVAIPCAAPDRAPPVALGARECVIGRFQAAHGRSRWWPFGDTAYHQLALGSGRASEISLRPCPDGESTGMQACSQWC